jgi:hypothetical protein
MFALFTKLKNQLRLGKSHAKVVVNSIKGLSKDVKKIRKTGGKVKTEGRKETLLKFLPLLLIIIVIFLNVLIYLAIHYRYINIITIRDFVTLVLIEVLLIFVLILIRIRVVHRSKNIGLKQARNYYKEIQKSCKSNYVNFKKVPCFLVLGKENSGKRTLLQSGRYKLISKTPSSNKINTWFSRSSVVISANDSYVSGSDSNLVCKDVSLMLRVMREKSSNPISAMLITVSASSILDNAEEKLYHYGKSISRYIYMIQNFLGRRIPVYFLITKSDKIVGFNSFFSNLEQFYKNTVFGYTSSQKNDNIIDVNIVNEELEKIVFNLEDIRSKSLMKIKIPNAFKKRMNYVDSFYPFTYHIKDILVKMKNLLKEAFAEYSHNKMTFPFRGLYFVSNKKFEPNNLHQAEGSSDKQMASNDSKKNESVKRTSFEEGSWFLTDLIEKIICSESKTVTPISSEFYKKRIVKRIILLCILVVFSLLSYLTYDAYFKLKSQIDIKYNLWKITANKKNWSYGNFLPVAAFKLYNEDKKKPKKAEIKIPSKEIHIASPIKFSDEMSVYDYICKSFKLGSKTIYSLVSFKTDQYIPKTKAERELEAIQITYITNFMFPLYNHYDLWEIEKKKSKRSQRIASSAEKLKKKDKPQKTLGYTSTKAKTNMTDDKLYLEPCIRLSNGMSVYEFIRKLFILNSQKTDYPMFFKPYKYFHSTNIDRRELQATSVLFMTSFVYPLFDITLDTILKANSVKWNKTTCNAIWVIMKLLGYVNLHANKKTIFFNHLAINGPSCAMGNIIDFICLYNNINGTYDLAKIHKQTDGILAHQFKVQALYDKDKWDNTFKFSKHLEHSFNITSVLELEYILVNEIKNLLTFPLRDDGNPNIFLTYDDFLRASKLLDVINPSDKVNPKSKKIEKLSSSADLQKTADLVNATNSEKAVLYASLDEWLLNAKQLSNDIIDYDYYNSVDNLYLADNKETQLIVDKSNMKNASDIFVKIKYVTEGSTPYSKSVITRSPKDQFLGTILNDTSYSQIIYFYETYREINEKEKNLVMCKLALPDYWTTLNFLFKGPVVRPLNYDYEAWATWDIAEHVAGNQWRTNIIISRGDATKYCLVLIFTLNYNIAKSQLALCGLNIAEPPYTPSNRVGLEVSSKNNNVIKDTKTSSDTDKNSSKQNDESHPKENKN